MNDYTFWYSETAVFKGGFKAENFQQAQDLLSQVFDGDTPIEELPEFWAKSKNFELEYSPETLEEH